MDEKPKIIAIIGPTATGKSDLGVALARRFGGEVISGDSRQVYRGLDIGSGKITKKEMRGVPHHLIDVANPKRVYSVARFQRDGRKAIAAILKKKKLPIVVGGTGFYIDALLLDMSLPNIKADMGLRRKLDKLSTEELCARLTTLDPKRAETVDTHNRVRLIRAIEIATHYGPVAPLTTTSSYDVCTIGISCEREVLKARIRARLTKRIKKGMIAEFKQLHEAGLSFLRMEALGLEYRYGARLLGGAIDRKTFETELAREIANYAKRQITWFKRNPRTHWISVDETIKAEAIVTQFLSQE